MKRETKAMVVRQATISPEVIRGRILTFRGVPVMLDRDLAELYGVPTGALNQAVNPTFHVREQNPSSCWGFARRSSLHGICNRYLRRFAANGRVTRRFAAKKVRRRGERGKSG